MSSAHSTAHAPVKEPAVLKEVRPANMPRREIIENHRDYSWITQKICGIVEGNAPKWWWIGFIMACFMASFTLAGLIYLVSTGTGVWGLRSPVFWGWAIVNFVFWIGIGHAGTLISAILCLLKQGNRNIWLICQVHRGSILLHTGRTDCLKGFPLANIPSVRYCSFFLTRKIKYE